MRKIFTFLIQLRYFFPALTIRFDDRLCKDLFRWKEIHHIDCSDRKAMAILLWRFKEFRNLVIYRLSAYPIRRRIVALFYPPLSTLFLDTPQIGGGLYIQHGFATMVAAKFIGENCWINQQVTIGYNGQGDPPIIGNWVTITCGAKVLGDIQIGNHVTVGANAVVIRNVPDNCIVGGVPAKVLRVNEPIVDKA